MVHQKCIGSLALYSSSSQFPCKSRVHITLLVKDETDATQSNKVNTQSQIRREKMMADSTGHTYRHTYCGYDSYYDA